MGKLFYTVLYFSIYELSLPPHLDLNQSLKLAKKRHIIMSPKD